MRRSEIREVLLANSPRRTPVQQGPPSPRVCRFCQESCLRIITGLKATNSLPTKYALTTTAVVTCFSFLSVRARCEVSRIVGRSADSFRQDGQAWRVSIFVSSIREVGGLIARRTGHAPSTQYVPHGYRASSPPPPPPIPCFILTLVFSLPSIYSRDSDPTSYIGVSSPLPSMVLVPFFYRGIAPAHFPLVELALNCTDRRCALSAVVFFSKQRIPLHGRARTTYDLSSFRGYPLGHRGDRCSGTS